MWQKCPLLAETTAGLHFPALPAVTMAKAELGPPPVSRRTVGRSLSRLMEPPGVSLPSPCTPTQQLPAPRRAWNPETQWGLCQALVNKASVLPPA